jgi:hypothetical protein
MNLVAVGPRHKLPEVSDWFKSCTTDGDEHIGSRDVVVLFESEGFIPVCYLLRNLIDQLFDQYKAGEPIADVRGNKISTQQFRVLVNAARKHIPEFEERFARSEVTRVSNILVKPQLLEHHQTLSRIKQQFMTGDSDRSEMKRQQQQSANAFDRHYKVVKDRAKRIFDELGPTESLTVRKVARTPQEYDNAMQYVTDATCKTTHASRGPSHA